MANENAASPTWLAMAAALSFGLIVSVFGLSFVGIQREGEPLSAPLEAPTPEVTPPTPAATVQTPPEAPRHATVAHRSAVRAEPNGGRPAITQLAKGAEVVVLESEGEWYFVEFSSGGARVAGWTHQVNLRFPVTRDMEGE